MVTARIVALLSDILKPSTVKNGAWGRRGRRADERRVGLSADLDRLGRFAHPLEGTRGRDIIAASEGRRAVFAGVLGHASAWLGAVG